jgi:DNA invertase Pin-like site-specific DNA recombinase
LGNNFNNSKLNKQGAAMPNAMYLRKSRAEEQASTEEVLARHRETLVELAVKKGIIVTDVFEEVVSGESLYSRLR